MKRSFKKIKRMRGGFVARPSTRARIQSGIMTALPTVIDTITPAIKDYVEFKVKDQGLDSVAQNRW